MPAAPSRRPGLRLGPVLRWEPATSEALRSLARRILFLTIAIGLTLPLVPGIDVARAARGGSESLFPRPKAIEPAVAFWRDVFAKYSTRQVVMHDTRHLDVVYEVIDLSHLGPPVEHLSRADEEKKNDAIREARKRIQAQLRSIDEKKRRGRALDRRERDLAAKLAHVRGRSKFRDAAGRVRGQSGLRERFLGGIGRQSGYLDEMQNIFRRRGLPVELVRMPLFESCFDLDAYSRVGAAGVWQFMPGTGRLYMRVDSGIDERRDPIRSTEAAAEHLAGNFEALGTWPLAITAYNHGRGGMARAVRQVGTRDIARIIARYQSRSFGFASRNFYPEFLAVTDLLSRPESALGPIPHERAPRSREVKLRRSLRLRDASRQTGVSREHLVAMNPAFLPRVIRGQRSIPRGYRLRVPVSDEDARIAMARPGAVPEIPDFITHRVRRGQTLSSIAKRYGTTVRELQGLNGVRRPRRLRAGQALVVPAP